MAKSPGLLMPMTSPGYAVSMISRFWPNRACAAAARGYCGVSSLEQYVLIICQLHAKDVIIAALCGFVPCTIPSPARE